MKPLYKKSFVFLSILLIILSNVSFVSADYNLEYDSNGNLIKDDKFSYEYDGFNQLIKIKEGNNLVAEYSYDQNGERIKKAEYSGRAREPVSITYYIGDFVRTVKGNKVSDSVYYYNDGQLVAKEENNKKYYYHPDYLGSTNLITDENGNLVSELSYLPFGESLSENNERFTFTGQESDKESDLMYYGARYYNPSSGRFIQPDSVIQDIYNPQNLNRYSYVLNNPYKYVDPSGNYVESALDVASLIWSVRDIKQDSGKILNWVSLGADIFTLALPGIAAGGAIIKGTTKTVKGLDKTNDAVRALDKGEDSKVIFEKLKNIKGIRRIDEPFDSIPPIKVKITDLYRGHPNNNIRNILMNADHVDELNPIWVKKVGDKYVIWDGVGRTTRAVWRGKSEVYANVIEEVGSLNELSRVDKDWILYSKRFDIDETMRLVENAR